MTTQKRIQKYYNKSYIIFEIKAMNRPSVKRQQQGPIDCVCGDAPKWIWDRFGASREASP